MKIAVMFGVAAISFSGSVVFARQAAAGAQTNATVEAGNMHVSQTTDTNASASTNRNGAMVSADAHSSTQVHPVNGELLGKLDSIQDIVGAGDDGEVATAGKGCHRDV